MKKHSQRKTGIVPMLFLGIVLMLAGCGSGGGGSAPATYIVGGTVNGLSGTLVLQNNGGDDLKITSDGTFTFSTALADGSNYNVTVKTQPDGQTCTVSNNTGTISGADVTDVAVTCSVDTYTVGGTVNGLSGTLVLQNNGGDDLTITADGAFTFNTPVADGSAYSVTILTHPVLQNCTVTNGSGTISVADVTDVAVNCAGKAWTDPSSLADNISPDGSDANDPQAAMDDSGNTIITWDQSDGSNLQIFRSEYRNNTWTYPSSLADHISIDGPYHIFYSDNPQVAMDDNGNAIIAWHQYDGSNWQIFKSEYRNGAWTYPSSRTDNITPDGQNAFDPQVAMDDNGNAIIVWWQHDGSNCQIFKSEYRNGVWTHPASLADNISPNGSDAHYQQVAMDDSGNTIIVWQQSDDSGDAQIFKSEYRNGAWTNPASLTDNISPDGSDASRPQVAMDDNGNAVIVWVQYDGGYQQIYRSEYRNGAWTDPSSLADNISPDGSDASRPQVAMDDNGNAVIVWEQYDGSGYQQIYRSEYR